jgi:hypothetical protein
MTNRREQKRGLFEEERQENADCRKLARRHEREDL